ncbi:spore coat U domain-containing protein [Providencia vermicola]|uniref:Spore coat protein U domain-containing protein n=2 Tax=Providencia TaxID=586 RepID=A0AAI9I3C5_PROST|nr:MULTISPECIES: spore coat protein U domain-containing protein [Providencia]ELR5044447.1 spore coat protein U domain-containing protein [Providencia rettgeri]ELR5037711.1 spore coat protein U domain-containing protein [Providencia stuartii]ELR5120423.1 spore coat protein U domain-containing protein [Providencia stuartii]ELR5142968.1 spore coat protein U domain-containing protein [Providencia stuartii]ELR5291975.1 spore coat protein U domain-containing protein [Providencia stuartii]
MLLTVKKTQFLIGLAFVSSPFYGANLATTSFQVLMTVTSTCQISVGSNINLGSVTSNTTNLSSSNILSVTCSKNTPFNIGLAPSLANKGTDEGSGYLAPLTNPTGNTDRIPYQLKQTSATGTNWGNTTTLFDEGNGVSGTGNGETQTFTVYAVVTNANFTPDTYSDVVTVNVNY